ncbi:MAG: hypothetical protein CME06_11830 [Gemmatimonadetes bacterium]|nr:hypothetical protein [Gemmatimonadota bacterium]
MREISRGRLLHQALWEQALVGDIAQAADHVQQAVTASKTPVEKAELDLLGAVIERRMGRLDKAEFMLQRGLVLAQEAECTALNARGLRLLANLFFERGDAENACRKLNIARRLDIDSGEWCRITTRLSDIESRRGNLIRSSTLLDEIESKHGKSQPLAIRRLTNTLLLGDPKAIKKQIWHVQRAAESTEAQPRYACLLARGVAHLHTGSYSLAAKQFRKARYHNDATLQNPDLDGEARLRQAEALVAAAEQRFRAREQLDELAARLDEFQNPLLKAEIHRVHAKALRLCGDSDASDAAYERCYALTLQSDRALYRFFALREHAEALLAELSTRAGAGSLLRHVLADARSCVRLFDHPVFEWQLRVLEALASSRLAPDPEICELEECRDRLHDARAKDEISEHHRDTWTELLEADIQAARDQLKAALAKDIEAMDDVVAGLRSEDVNAHLREFTSAVGERFGADRVAMVIESDAQGTLDVIAAHGLSDGAATEVARALIDLMGPDEPALIRDLAADTNPIASKLRQTLPPPAPERSLDEAVAGAPRSALAFAIDGGGVVVGLIYLDRPTGPDRPAYRSADLRDFAFLSNGLAAVSRLASSRASHATRAMQDRLRGVTRSHGIVTRSRHFLALMDRLERVAAADIPILIRGESGTGKELVARAVHAASNRPDGPFIAVNCAAIPESLIEAELFGYRRGAFTGAERDRRGYFVAASGGTLFLDEIGELPLPLQAKFLRALEESRVTPLGRSEPVPIDTRIVAATNAGLEAGSFRQDLYYRLRGFALELPPLRDRPEDIRILADHFLAHQAVALGLPDDALRFTAEAYKLLERHDWPGNVRELRQVVHSASILRDLESNEVGADALMDHVGLRAADTQEIEAIDAGLLGRISMVADRVGATGLLAGIEHYLTDRALERSGGNQRAAARALDMGESTLRKKLEIRAREGVTE